MAVRTPVKSMSPAPSPGSVIILKMAGDLTIYLSRSDKGYFSIISLSLVIIAISLRRGAKFGFIVA